ncbi:MAG TPA: isoprenylcysteine carboxylmethyltransferase family protein [Bryobacteraceae bacterium]
MEYRGVQYRFAKPYADFVARLRVPCGFLLLVTFAWLSRPNAESMSIGLSIAVPGLLLRGWAAGHLAKNEALATGGPYAYVRNPLYAGTLVVALGIVIACRSIPLAIVFVAVFALVYFPVIELEEQHLRDIFPAYSGYASRVRRFWPRFGRKAVTGRFRWKLYFKNEEYKALAGFALAVVWLTAKRLWLPG